ncbi:hypothetical protein FWF89_01555 [Candidatus Saccharibacteria bacterium]|nr:hypothetical protein [Candidatus Saccharibacteria bacterium]
MVKDKEKDTGAIVNWEAQEYVVRDKNTGWYIGLVIVGLSFSALAVWLQQWTFLALIVVSVIAIIVYSSRPPRMLHYSLSNKGLSEGNKLYDFGQFKAFGVMRDDKRFSIVLIPRKRFSPRVTVYFPEAQGEQIVDIFGERLPMEEVKMDFLDKIVRFLRI